MATCSLELMTSHSVIYVAAWVGNSSSQAAPNIVEGIRQSSSVLHHLMLSRKMEIPFISAVMALDKCLSSS